MMAEWLRETDQPDEPKMAYGAHPFVQLAEFIPALDGFDLVFHILPTSVAKEERVHLRYVVYQSLFRLQRG
jgi:hypothetical protein